MNTRRLFSVIVTWSIVLLLSLACGCGPKADHQAAPEPKGFGELEAVDQSDRNGTDLLPGEEYFIHTVQWPGESLSIIAKWYIGRLMDWEILAAHNPDLDPNRIYVGDRIRIPESRMRTSEPMPREFVEQFLPPEPDKEADRKMGMEPIPGPGQAEEAESGQDRERKEDREAEQEPAEEFELFGPKGLDSD